MTLLAQLSDPHIVADGLLGDVLDTETHLAAAVADINRSDTRPDGVLVTGDLTEDGTAGAYERLAATLDRLEMPWWAITGNHDLVDVAAAALGDHLPAGGPTPGTGIVNVGDVAIVALNTAVAGRPDGNLTEADLEWVPDALAEAQTTAEATVLAMHHPPVPVGLAHMDTMRLDDDAARQLEAIVDGHVVDVVIAGHLHRLTVTRWGGTVIVTAPGVAHATGRDLGVNAPLAVTLEPPAYLMHRFSPTMYPTTHLYHVGDFPTRVLNDQPAR